MATFYHESAQPSWQGNYFPREANQNGPTWVTRTMSVTAAQAVSANKFYLFKLSRNTVVLDGYLYAAGLDVNASTTALVDVGYVSDAAGDGDPADNPDWFLGDFLGDIPPGYDDAGSAIGIGATVKLLQRAGDDV